MKRLEFAALAAAALLLLAVPPASADLCVDCHKTVTPGAVNDWQLSVHSANDVSCSDCHGEGHTSAADVAKVSLPTPQTCANCHSEQVDQYTAGKHSKAWVVMNAMPTIHWQAPELIEGMKGCGGCHKLGYKSEEEIRALAADGHTYGNASCDACHTRHLFSVEEARQPQACQTCHMGFDHPQWEMYTSSKHGVRYRLKQLGILPEDAAAPTCQTCHMAEGNHAVRTAWGFLAVRLPMPEDEQWAADRATVLMGLGVLDPEGNPTGRLEAVKAADIARLDAADWQQERDKMLATCTECHAKSFAKGELEKGDGMIREADHLMADAIRTVASLYEKGIIEKPESYAYNYPDLLTFHDAPRPIEQKLHVMFLKYRMRAFQGTFHASPDYSLWYGWGEMKMALSEIKQEAAELAQH